MIYDAWNPSPGPLDKPSVRTFDDWVYELTSEEYLEILEGIYEDEKEILDTKKLIKNNEGPQEIRSLLEEKYRIDVYDDINYVW